MERRHDVEVARLGETVGLVLRFVEVDTMFDQLGAERAHRLVLLDRVAMRDQNDAPEADGGGGARDRLAVIAARRRDHARDLRAGAHQLIHIDDTAAHLEGPDRRMILVLDEYPQPARRDSSGQ